MMTFATNNRPLIQLSSVRPIPLELFLVFSPPLVIDAAAHPLALRSGRSQLENGHKDRKHDNQHKPAHNDDSDRLK